MPDFFHFFYNFVYHCSMRKLLLLLLMIGFVTFSYSQITVLPQTSNIVLIGKIKIGNADASSFFRPKIKIKDENMVLKQL